MRVKLPHFAYAATSHPVEATVYNTSEDAEAGGPHNAWGTGRTYHMTIATAYGRLASPLSQRLFSRAFGLDDEPRYYKAALLIPPPRSSNSALKTLPWMPSSRKTLTKTPSSPSISKSPKNRSRLSCLLCRSLRSISPPESPASAASSSAYPTAELFSGRGNPPCRRLLVGTHSYTEDKLA